MKAFWLYMHICGKKEGIAGSLPSLPFLLASTFGFSRIEKFTAHRSVSFNKMPLSDAENAAVSFYSSLTYARFILQDYWYEYEHANRFRQDGENRWLECIKRLTELLAKIYTRARSNRYDLVLFCENRLCRRWLNKILAEFDEVVENFWDGGRSPEQLARVTEVATRVPILEDIYVNVLQLTLLMKSLGNGHFFQLSTGN
jgi:hypothetical protein